MLSSKPVAIYLDHNATTPVDPAVADAMDAAVRDEYGNLLYRLDLGYRQQRVGLEYDGKSHAEQRRLSSDRERMNWLARHGWTMRYFTDRDLYQRPSYIVSEVRAALAG